MSARRDLERIIARLELKSHAHAAQIQPEPASRGGSRGGNRPPGGIDVRDDKEPEFHLKSADHFRRRLARARSDRAVQLILVDAEKALAAWERTPLVGRPLPGSPFFRRWIIDQLRLGENPERVAQLGGCTREYVNKVRRQEERA